MVAIFRTGSASELRPDQSGVAATMEDIGATGKIVAKSGSFPSERYDAQTNSTLAKITKIDNPETSTRNERASQEVLLSQNPDLVAGK